MLSFCVICIAMTASRGNMPCRGFWDWSLLCLERLGILPQSSRIAKGSCTGDKGVTDVDQFCREGIVLPNHS